MESLNCKSLMIGDWVLKDMNYSEEDPMCTKLDYRPYQITSGEDIDIAIESNCIGDGSIYLPIPLTPEIIEKIGFNKVPQQGCSNPFFWMLEKYEKESEELLYRIQAYKTMFRGMYISIDNYANGYEVTRINPEGISESYDSQAFQNALDFLLREHFDIFGLIPKGLAIEVTEENNPYSITEE